MEIPLLIMNVQVFSSDMAAYCLTSKEAILRQNTHTVIKIPTSAAKSVNGGPVVGQRYFVRYVDGIASDFTRPEFRYLGTEDEQFIFASATRMQPA